MNAEGTTLYSLCLEFIASHINHVDSLVGFPQSVGFELFKECVKNGMFLNVRKNVKAVEALKIFCEAYEGTLSSLDLTGCHLIANDIFSDHPWLFSGLRHLDLSLCLLGDDHELLPLVFGLKSLETLNLSNNCLSDKGIWKGTVRLRFQSQTNKCLKNLNLSSNKVTERFLDHLKPLIGLCVVIVSDSSLKFRKSNSNQFRDGRFNCHAVCSCPKSLFEPPNPAGWASQVINGWKEEYFELSNHKDKDILPLKNSSSSSSCTFTEMNPHGVKSFYSRGLSLNQATNHEKSPSLSSNLILTTSSFHCEHISCKEFNASQSSMQRSHSSKHKSKERLNNVGHSYSQRRKPTLLHGMPCHPESIVEFGDSDNTYIAESKTKKPRLDHDVERERLIVTCSKAVDGKNKMPGRVNVTKNVTNKAPCLNNEKVTEVDILDMYASDQVLKPKGAKGNILSKLYDWS